ncbi:hypothetical protein AB4Z34_22395 [Ensifer sp. 2YAB10]|jgi:hypothetical protein|uniref:hypothetical protein n=1 Tax=Ensifer TaxID=106591 RepID=UPI0013B0449F|nr:MULTISPECIES: hypothetical protein [Ensifer]MBK5568484.1 hypothetical protein [Ensifer sp. SSB1]MBZ7921867.1 hypothetical protein [Ensifer adhaerens]UAX94265.1 hypothetical protein LAC78_08740 [Ensifer adhaerens]UAY01900.1 hypothetical protein LAC80_08750 [Ensifer adhaerens]UAY09283.1 hypothetical protein LAC81_08745 [Ensifer adhaerens]
MRGSFFAMALAIVTALALGTPAQAGNYSYGCKPSCVVKTVKTYGAYGAVILKKVRICN